MKSANNSTNSRETLSERRPTYSAPRLQRLGRVSDLTQASGGGIADAGYMS